MLSPEDILENRSCYMYGLIMEQIFLLNFWEKILGLSLFFNVEFLIDLGLIFRINSKIGNKEPQKLDIRWHIWNFGKTER
jgi:hypothetical protein